MHILIHTTSLFIIVNGKLIWNAEYLMVFIEVDNTIRPLLFPISVIPHSRENWLFFGIYIWSTK